MEIAREGLAKPRGRYVTLEMPSVSVLDERDAAVIETCAAELRALLPDVYKRQPVHSPAPTQVQTTSRSRVMTALWMPTSRKSDKKHSSVCPVSYTHLDVDKRQVHCC